jgi:hypothetical protein
VSIVRRSPIPCAGNGIVDIGRTKMDNLAAASGFSARMFCIVAIFVYFYLMFSSPGHLVASAGQIYEVPARNTPFFVTKVEAYFLWGSIVGIGIAVLVFIFARFAISRNTQER